MKKIVIKIGGSMDADLRKAFIRPSKENGNTHTIYLKNSKELCGILSPKRLDLLMQVINGRPKKATIGGLARKLKRKREAISRDAALLEKCGILQKVKEKQSVYLKPNCDAVQLQFANAR